MPTPIPWLASILAAMSAIGPFAIDTYLPAFDAISRDLGASQLAVQQTLTAYMVTFAVMVLWHGALADSYGRKRVVIVANLIFALASLLCAVAPDIRVLWLGRALQGMSAGAGMVIGRAIVRDVFEGAAAQHLLARVMTIFAIAPAIAPVVGGQVLAHLGWRAIFVFLALWSGGLAWMCWRKLPETLPAHLRQPMRIGHLWRGYRSVFTTLPFLLLSAAIALNFNGYFVYVLTAPVFVVQHLGLGTQGFGWLFVPAVAGMMLGSWLSGRCAVHWPPIRTVGTGFAVMLGAAVFNTAYARFGIPNLFWSVAPIALFNLGMALAMPALTLLALDCFPQQRGLAASSQSLLQVGTNAISASVIAPLLWSSPFGISLGMLGFTSLGLICFSWWWRARGRSAQA